MGISLEELLDARQRPAWVLLRAVNAPLILGFLASAFADGKHRSLPASEIVDKLDQYLDYARELNGAPDAYPLSAQAYISEWSRPETGYLRKTLESRRKEPMYEPTSAVEIALDFTQALRPREFIGTASRLLTIRDLLRQITAGAAVDPTARLQALYAQRDEIQTSISALESGNHPDMDEAAIRERYDRVVDTARELLRDLRRVEESMRVLDRTVRAKVTTWTGPRGELLDAIIGEQSTIDTSDEGRSWQAFWEFLLSSQASEELERLLSELRRIPALGGRGEDARQLLRTDLFGAATVTQRVIASLSAQLRRFLDERNLLEEARVRELAREVLARGIELADENPKLRGGELDDLRAPILIAQDRPLYIPRFDGDIDIIDATAEDTTDVDFTPVRELAFMDLDRLSYRVTETLKEAAGPVTIGAVALRNPITDGLAELIGYLQVTQGMLHRGDGSEDIVVPDRLAGLRVARLPALLIESDNRDIQGGSHGNDEP